MAAIHPLFVFKENDKAWKESNQDNTSDPEIQELSRI